MGAQEGRDCPTSGGPRTMDMATVLSRLGTVVMEKPRQVANWYVEAESVQVGGTVVKRHEAVREAWTMVDGDGNEVEVEEAPREGLVRVMARGGAVGWVEKAWLRSPDELDALAEGPRQIGERRLWLKLASAVRTDNPVKIKLLVDKLERRGPATTPGRETLRSKAVARARYHKVRHYCERIEQVPSVREVAEVRDAVRECPEAAAEWLPRVEAHGTTLTELRAVFGDPEDDKSPGSGRGYGADPEVLAWIADRIKHYRDKPGAVIDARLEDAINVRLDAARAALLSSSEEEAEEEEGPSSRKSAAGVNPSRVAEDDSVLTLRLSAPGSPIDGSFARVVMARGFDAHDKYDSHETCGGRCLFRSLRDPSYAIVWVPDGARWIAGLKTSDREELPHPEDFEPIATAPALRGPWRFVDRSFLSRERGASSTSLSLAAITSSVQHFCKARLYEGRIYAARAEATPADAVDLATGTRADSAAAAEGALAEAVALFRLDAVSRSTKVDVYLARAANRLVRRDPRAALRDVDAIDAYLPTPDQRNAGLLVAGRAFLDLGRLDDAANRLRLATDAGASSSDRAPLQRALAQARAARRANPLRGALVPAASSR